MKKAVLFCRVSSDKQDYNRQVSDLMPLAKADGYRDSEIAVITHKESASKNDIANRMSISELRDLMQANPIESVYVTEISRLARRDDVLNQVLADLNQRGIALVSQNPMLLRTFEKVNGKMVKNDTTSLIIKILSYVAEQEIKTKKDRQKSGYQQKLREGKLVSSKVINGYRRSKDNYPEIDPEDSKVIISIFRMYLAGDSVNTIFSKVRYTPIFKGIVSASAGRNKIARILRDRTYIGEHDKFNYPPLIDRDLFDQVQAKMDSNQLVKSETKYVYYCQGLIHIDGYTLTPNAAKCNYLYRNHDSYKSVAAINVNVIDDYCFNQAALAAAIYQGQAQVENTKKLEEQLRKAEDSVEGLQQAVDRTKKKIDRLQDFYFDGKISREQYDQRVAQTEKELQSVIRQQDENNVTITNLRASLSSQSRQTESIGYNNLSSITDDNLKRDLVREYVKSIELTRQEDNSLKITVSYKDNIIPDDELLYIKRGPKLYLYQLDGDVRVDLTGSWSDRVKSLDKRRRSLS